MKIGEQISPRRDQRNSLTTFEPAWEWGAANPRTAWWKPIMARAKARHPAHTKGAASYKDYRELLAKQQDLDAVYIATPDHWHAAISIAAMRKRKHVLCQKPMTHSIADARRVAAVARETKVATSITVNNPSTDNTKLMLNGLPMEQSELFARSTIGPAVRIGRRESSGPKEVDPVPEGLDWDMWLGPAAERPFNKAYLPFVWRGWYDFGDGSFGDMGCYSFAGVFTILNLTPPVSVESSTSAAYRRNVPESFARVLEFSGRGSAARSCACPGMTEDSGRRGPRVFARRISSLFESGKRVKASCMSATKASLLGGFNGNHPRVYPESPSIQTPAVRREHRTRSGDGPMDRGLQRRPSPKANFESQAPVTEAFLLGCIAQRSPGEFLEWDTEKMRITSSENANKYVDPPVRSEYKV